jgi:5,10-methylene-tetrahydrofolate dehydrogenase/methenyl tetrahydrofolate cyclohydrolase
MASIIDGNKTAADIRREIKEETARLKQERGILPGLPSSSSVKDPASAYTVRREEERLR